MKRTLAFVFLPLLIAVFTACGEPVKVDKNSFSAEQKNLVACARIRTHVLYDFFDTEVPIAERQSTIPAFCGGDPAKPVKIPEYLAKELPEMMQTPVRFEGYAGVTHVESDVWWQVFRNLNSILSAVENSWDPEKASKKPEEMRADFANSKNHMSVDLDRLNTPVLKPGGYYSMRDSMEGRGRQLIATFSLIDREIDSLLESYSAGDTPRQQRFVESVTAIAILTNNVYLTMMTPPLPEAPERFFTTKKMSPSGVLIVFFGVLIVFFGVFTWLSTDYARIESSFMNYLDRSNNWADDFNRQFSKINVKYLVLGTIGGFAAAGLLMALAVGGIVGIMFFFMLTVGGFYVGLKMPGMVLQNLKETRGKKVNAQIMDALILLTNSLKSGMDIVQGFEMVSHDSQPPISEEFGLVIKNYRLGTTFERALEGLEDRIESRLLSYMIKAIVLQRQVGGNLTKIFERIVETIREESKLEDKVQALTAQQKMQAIVVGIVPWLMVGMMFMAQPDTMINFYTSILGVFTLMFCIVWMIIGLKLVSKLGEVKV